MSFFSSPVAGEDTGPQSHLFASLFSFSDEAQRELLAQLQANTLASETQCEWLNSKHLNIVCNDETTVSILFDTFTKYINKEKDGAREAYEVSKLERSIETIVRTSRDDEPAEEGPIHPEDVRESITLLAELVPHEMISRVWCLEDGLRSGLAKRFLRPLVFEMIGKFTNCEIISGADKATITVKGDNDHDVENAMKNLDNLAKAISLFSKRPLTYELVINEAGRDVSFQIRALDDEETNDQRSTTIIGTKSFRFSRLSDFGVVLMIEKGRRIITLPRTGVAGEAMTRSSNERYWQSTRIPCHGSQAINFASLEARGYFAPSQTASFKSPIPLQNKVLADATTNPEHASRFVEEWVQTTAETTCQPFEPAMQPLNEESHGVLDDAEAADGPIRASPAKRRHAKVRKRPKAECDADIEDGDDVSVHDPVEPQFMSSGEARSSQPTSYAHSLIQDPNGAKTEERLIDIRGEDSWAGAHQPANVINVQRSLTFVNPSPQIIPMGNSQKPASPGPRPATKLIRAPTAVRDLLTDEGPGIAYPVAVPAPAIKGPYMPPKSQKLASNVSDLPADGSVEGWLKSNPTMAASGVLKDNPLLIGDGENKASAGYAAAAKRGAARSRGAPRARGTTRGRIYKGVAPPNERLQSSSELQSRQVYRTMNQKMAKPNVGQTSQLEAFESATIQLLQSANTFRGMVNLEVDVGRVLVKAGKGAIGRTFLPSDWSSIFDGPTGNKPETVFINMLPASDIDVKHVANLKQSNGRPMFAEDPYESTVKYNFVCGTRSGDEEVILEADASGRVRALSIEHLAGAVNWHFPKHQWDARLAVKVTEQIQDFQESVEAITRTLSVIPSSDGRTAKLFAELGNTSLVFRSANILRETRFQSLLYTDIVMSCTEVQELGPAKDRHRYWNSLRDVEGARQNGDLWWEIKLESVEAAKKLQRSVDLPLGKEAEWKAEDIVRQGAVKELHKLARDIVTHIDGIGASVNMASKTAFVAHRTLAKKKEEEEEAAKESATFW